MEKTLYLKTKQEMFTLDVVSFILAVVSLYAPNLNLFKFTFNRQNASSTYQPRKYLL